MVIIMILVAFSFTTTIADKDSHLVWMSSYDFDPVNQHDWSYGMSSDISAINGAYLKYKMSSMFELPYVTWNITYCSIDSSRYPVYYRHPSVTLCPNWSSNLKDVTSMIQPYIDNKTVVGYFIGDELCCGGLPFSNFTSVVDQIRKAAGNDIFVYTNECTPTFEPNNSFTWTSIPDGLNWISIDYYDVGNGTHEYVFIKTLYENNIFPLLKNKTKYGYHQQAVFVPGTFACNSSTAEIEYNSQQIVITLNDLFEWAKNDSRIAGFCPWHFANRSTGNSNFVPKGCAAGADTLAPGAIAMSNVVAKLKEIGQYIIGS